jgi:hypothetical protein
MPRKYIRKTGAAARALPRSYRQRLREFRSRHAANLGLSTLSIPLLKTSMSAPFTWETLQRAIAGKPIRACNCQFIEEFLDRYLPRPVPAAGIDGKSAAAGEHEEESPLQEFVRRGRDAQDAVDELIHRGSR